MDACTNCDTPLPRDSRFCPRCGTPVPGVTTEELLASGASDPTGLLDRLRHTIGDEFRVLRELGRGGMGRVYLAHELALDRRVAMKVLPPAFAEHREIVERFKREARTAGKLTHPNIVSVYQVSERDGLTFFTMPYISGPSLRNLLQATPQLEGATVRRYLREAAEALAYAHSQGVIHRDIKPENILLEGGPEGRLLLTDFGIAKALGAGTTLTRPGEMIGTPYYMSPEQCEEKEEIDGRSDQYSLGLVGYEMLAGRFPFTGESMATVVYKHLFEELEPLERLREDVDEDLRQAIARATRKKRDARFPTMRAFAEALGGSSHRPAARSVAERSGGGRPHRFRSRAVLGAAAALLLVGAGGAAYYWANAGSAESLGSRSANLTAVADETPPSRADEAAPVEDSLNTNVGGLAARGTAEDGATRDGAARGGPATTGTESQQPDTDANRAAPGTPVGRAGSTNTRPASRPGQTATTGRAAENLRAQLESRREAAEGARTDARRAGADTLFPAEFRQANGLVFGALGALGERQPGVALKRLAAARAAFEGLAGRARTVVAGTASGAPDTAASAAEAQPVSDGGPVGEGTPSPRLEETPEAAITALLSVYARALEAKDSERLRENVYGGEIPADDARIFRLWFQRAEDLHVRTDLEDVSVEGDRAQARVHQVMQFRLARTDEPRNTTLSLGMVFRRTAQGWRLAELRQR